MNEPEPVESPVESIDGERRPDRERVFDRERISDRRSLSDWERVSERERVPDRLRIPDRQRVSDGEPFSPRSTAPPSRVIGSPLPMGSGRLPAGRPGPGSGVQSNPPGRALPASTNPGSTSAEEPSGVQRAMNAVRAVMPVVQRLLPLLEGNVLTAISNVLTPRPQAPPPAPKIDLAPIENSLTELQTQHRGLRDQVIEQNATLKRVEDRLELVREATDRNTLEQQELLEDLKLFSRKVKIFVAIGIGMLVIGIVLNLLLFLHIERVLP
jgi:hypothetical protein